MKHFLVGVALVLLVSCREVSSPESKPVDSAGLAKPQTLNEHLETGWYDDFRALQNAFKAGDRSAAKQFFNFPIYSDENVIWALAGLDPHASVDPGTGETKQMAFKEQDFDRGFHRLFPAEFIEGLSNLGVSELKPGAAVGHELAGNDSHEHTFLVRLDSAVTSLEFVVITRYKRPKGSLDDEDETELSMVGYTFAILRGKTLRFREVGLGD